MRRSIFTTSAALLAAVVTLVGAAGCGAGDKDGDKDGDGGRATTTSVTQLTAKMSVVKIAGLDGQFSQFLDLVRTAGLEKTLTEEGPFTVLAPESAAIIKLGKARIDDLKSDPDALRAVLEDHLISGELSLADLAGKNGATVETVGGGRLAVAVKGNEVRVGGAKVLKSDIDADNGVIYVVDRLVQPEG